MIEFVIADRWEQVARKLIVDEWKQSQEPVTRTLVAPQGANEAQLRDSGKWETIRHHKAGF